MNSVLFHQIQPLPLHPFHSLRHFPPPLTSLFSAKTPPPPPPELDSDVKTLAKFRSRYNYIRVLEVSRKAHHPFSNSRLLLLDYPGNIHSITFLHPKHNLLTFSYFDVFATFPPILPPGPVGILGFGAGSAALLILELYPRVVLHGWELDPAVINVGREYFGLGKLERENKERLFVYVGNALNASLRDGFAGILVDLFSRGSLVPELQESGTWERLARCLRKGGRVMVNVGGSCVEPEDGRRDGNVLMEQTLRAMYRVFGDGVCVLRLGDRMEGESSIALTGGLPDVEKWREALTKDLRGYVDMWMPYRG